MVAGSLALGALSAASSLLSTAYDRERTSQRTLENLSSDSCLKSCVDGGRTIRLLRIGSGGENEPLRCEPWTQPHRDAQYQALSYTWGTQHQSDASNLLHKASISKRPEQKNTCTQWSADEKWEEIQVRPSFSGLDLWMTNGVEHALRSVHLRLPKPFKQPSPQLLLGSWLLLTLAIIAHRQRSSEDRYERMVLPASLCTAVMIGVAEGSDMTSIVLTNIPWCLTISMMLGSILRGVLQVKSQFASRRGGSRRQMECERREKDMC